jgi:hypothetical protein
MTTIDVPEAELVSLTLLPHHRETLGTAEDIRAQPDRVSIGRPVCVPLDAATVDDDAKVFLGEHQGSAYFLLALTASFTPDEENPLVSAWVDVTMSTSEPVGAPEPVAWSMKPLSAADPVTISRKVSFNGSLKLTVGPMDIGPDAGSERVTSYARSAISVEALREGTNRPQWRFYTTEIGQVRGVHHLFLIAQTAAMSKGVADVSIGATVQLHRLKIFRYSAALEHLPNVAQVALPPG